MNGIFSPTLKLRNTKAIPISASIINKDKQLYRTVKSSFFERFIIIIKKIVVVINLMNAFKEEPPLFIKSLKNKLKKKSGIKKYLKSFRLIFNDLCFKKKINRRMLTLKVLNISLSSIPEKCSKDIALTKIARGIKKIDALFARNIFIVHPFKTV